MYQLLQLQKGWATNVSILPILKVQFFIITSEMVSGRRQASDFKKIILYILIFWSRKNNIVEQKYN